MKNYFKRVFKVFKTDKTLLITVLLLWIKSYLIMRLFFDLPLDNMLQEFILLLSPLSSVLVLTLITVSIFRKNKKRGLFIMYVTSTILLFANVVYYRFFEDFITVPILFQFKNFGDLGGSAKGLMEPYDILMFIDVVVYYYFLKKDRQPTLQKHNRKLIATFAALLLLVNVGLAEKERPQLLTRTFDREMLVKFLGVYNYHVYDLAVHSKASAQRTFAESSDLTEVENYIQRDIKQPSELFGVAEGKNVIMVSMESLQNFVINYELNGEEVTPFLNDLIGDSFYFNNFYHQTGQGKTSDSEFLVDNSLYPLSRGAVFTTNASNEYNAMPEILQDNGYTTASFHGNNKSFWNRDIMYQSLGYDYFFSERYYDIKEEESINYGLKDKPFFRQSIPMMQELEQPFHSKFITLTNHYPYLLDEEDEMIAPHTTGNKTVDRYFQTVRYFDDALRDFFEQLKANGLYENSIFVLYGDHYGISQNHNRAMSEVIGKEITPFEHIQLQKVPLLIHIPGMEGKTMETVSGQIDLKPTILHLLGIEQENDIQFGADLFATNRDDFVVLRDGSFITDEYVYTKETCYDKTTGQPTEDSLCEPAKEKAQLDLNLSDKVVQSDLLRFLDSEKNTTEEEASGK
ncbi:LTA synthase family protein [Bacillus solimangrovi]|uniref:LTA synthase family protein n=1 Tax=Bacillus solimangrovi TaxID=1305675 RepID=UPI000AEC8A73|nr:LTA synthase family protein [Bacillus solimangrovi]